MGKLIISQGKKVITEHSHKEIESQGSRWDRPEDDPLRDILSSIEYEVCVGPLRVRHPNQTGATFEEESVAKKNPGKKVRVSHLAWVKREYGWEGVAPGTGVVPDENDPNRTSVFHSSE